MGSDPHLPQRPDAPGGFNSRSRMGSDLAQTRLALDKQVFQFALPHGERPRRMRRRLRFM